jgi:Bacterial PH domain
MDERVQEGGYQRYQNVRLLVVRAAGIWGLALVIAAMTIAGALSPNSGAPVTIGATAFFAAVAVLLLWLGFRATASGIFTGPDGVVIRRLLRCRVWLPWPDVTGFDLVRARRLDNGYTRQSVAVAILRAGSNKPLYCLGASFTEPESAADQMLAALRNDQAGAIQAEAVRSSADLRLT